ncbi:MAG: ATP-binding cassette domain-containing protein [Acidimicrobiia bacterium]|nr:ATP-binding cassette domain-containing protein [Acidimicrobiia bacterium]
MPAIHLDHLSFSYSSAVRVFEDASVHLGDGWIGVVGTNGAGKSTLLSLIDGELEPTSGRLTLDPRGAVVMRCPQEVDTPTAAIESFALSTDGVSRMWMGKLDIDPSGLGRWESLSPGERKRWQLGAALAADPHLLLLDEPTNHLDSRGRRLVESALGQFRGVGLVISHDRGLLDRLTTRTLRVRGGALRLWSAPYTVAREEWVAEEAAAAERYASARRSEKALRRRLADERRAADERNARFRRQVRQADPKDHDATSMAAKGRHESGKVAGQRRRTVIRAGLERAAAAADELAPDKLLGSAVTFGYEPSPKRVLLRYEGPLRAGPALLADHVDVAVAREDRIRLVGENGVGKSTLLVALLADLAIPADRVLYLPQELTRAEGVRLLDRLDALDTARRGRVLSIVAALGVDPDTLMASANPSPGEARKLAMSLGLGTGAWILVLDEPTNHLDLPAVERIESALEAYPGAVLMVTHDEAFAAAVTWTIWHLEKGALGVRYGVDES